MKTNTLCRDNSFWNKWSFWILLIFIYLSISFFISYFGLFGDWRTYVLGIRHQKIWDPGSAYLASGISFFDQKNVSFYGHPGLPLMFLIQLTARIFYWIGLVFGTSASSFNIFLAKNLFWLILFSKLMITIVHIISFYMIFIIANKLLKDKLLAYIAVLAYGTTYPILFYINNISVEPFLVLFTLLSIFFLWKYYEHTEENQIYRGYAFLILTSFSVTAAFYTKMLIIGPLLFFVPIYILFKRKSLDGTKIFPLKSRIKSFMVFISSSSLFLFIGGYKIDWVKFFKYWFKYAPGTPVYDSSDIWFNNIVKKALAVLVDLLKTCLGHMKVKNFIPSASKQGLFNAAETLFILLSVIGFIIFWKTNSKERSYTNWFLYIIAITIPLVFYRLFTDGAWHYLVIYLAFAAIFFSYFIKIIINKAFNFFNRTVNKKKVFAAALMVTLIVHSVSFMMFYNAKTYDIKAFQKSWKNYYKALQIVDYKSKIGLIKTDPPKKIHGNMYRFLPKSSKPFKKAFASFFVRLRTMPEDEELKKRNISVVLEGHSDGIEIKKILK